MLLRQILLDIGCANTKKLTRYFSSSNVREPLYKDVGVLGVPTRLGQKHQGVRDGPDAIRASGLVQKVTDMGIDIVDYGNVEIIEKFPDPPRHRIKYPRTHATNAMNISDAVEMARKENSVVFCIGGDHSLSIGTIHGHSRVKENVCLIWVDAHADLNTPLSSTSGNLHGMPLSFLIKEVQDYMPHIEEFNNISPCLSAKDIVFIGLRDIDPGERFIIEKLGISVFGMHDVDQLGISEVIRQGIKQVNPLLDRPIHLSFDIDSMDPSSAGSTGTPVPAGLTVREGLFIAEEVHRTGCLSVVDLVELNPQLGSSQSVDQTVYAAVEVIRACLGWQRAGLVPANYRMPLPGDFGLPRRNLAHKAEIANKMNFDDSGDMS